MSFALNVLVDKSVTILTADGRILVGTLRGYDQATNVILSSAEERVFSSTEAVQIEPLGVYLLRGDNVALIGETEVEIDAQVNWAEVRADPVPELRHFQ